MIQYNLNLLTHLFDDFSYLIKATVSYYDQNFQPTSAHSKWSEKHICELVKGSWGQTHNCTCTDEATLQRLKNGENAFYYTCHFGLIEMAFRFSVEKETYGYVIIGPFKSHSNTKEITGVIKKLCKDDDKLYENAISFYKKIPTFSLDKYYAIKSLSYAIFEYAINHNVIVEKSSFFSENIEKYILENLNEKFSIENLCQKFFLTQKQLYSVFLKNTNKTPKRYINEIKVNKAKKLIITTDMALPDIADSVGVQDYNYFIKIFKMYDGHTPMYYRKK